MRILAVTVLTSLDQVDIHEMGYACAVRQLFDLRVRNAVRAGVDGLVCSPLEVRDVRRVVGPDKLLVTPGRAERGCGEGRPERVATPAQAMADGASHLVIGRQVTRAADPDKAVREILAELRPAGR